MFSRYIECIPIRNANAVTIKRMMTKHIFLRYGSPDVILSDNGSPFKNEELEKYNEKLGITPMYVPPPKSYQGLKTCKYLESLTLIKICEMNSLDFYISHGEKRKQCESPQVTQSPRVKVVRVPVLLGGETTRTSVNIAHSGVYI